MTAEERARKLVLYSIGSDFWRCPNTHRVLMGIDHDDKVLCPCRKPNPYILRPEHGGDPEHGHENGGLRVHHIKRFLTRATVEEYLDQEESDKRTAEWRNGKRDCLKSS